MQNITWTLEKDSIFDFSGITYYDGLGFMISIKLGVSSATELDGAKVCLQTKNEINVSDFFQSNKIKYEPILYEEFHEMIQAYISGFCDVVTANAVELATKKTFFTDTEEHIVLPEIISKEPLGIVVRQNNFKLKDIIQWTLSALITAEEMDIDSETIEEILKNSNNVLFADFLELKEILVKNSV